MSLFRSASRVPVANAKPDFSGLAIQTATAAAAIPIVYGTTRVAPNIIWRDGATATPQYQTTRSGGKGGGGTQTSVAGYDYSTWIEYAIGEGPIGNVLTVWNGQSTASPGSLNLGLVNGTTPQQPWAPAQARFAYAALPYNGTAYLASSSFDLGSSASLPAIAFEVQGLLQASAASLNGADCDPAVVIGDFLTNPQYGVGFPPAALDATALYGAPGDASLQSYCRAAGLAFSPQVTDQEKANSILARWLQLVNATAVWSGGRLKVIPFGDAPLAGYTPNGAAVYDLGDDDFVHADGADPVEVARVDPFGVANVQRLECFDRANQYAATPVEARDQNAIECFGLTIGSTITAHEYCDLGIGLAAAQLILQRGLYIRNTYRFKLSWECCLLEPMDLVTLTDAGLGLFRTPVRLTAVEEDESGILSVTAEECPGGVAAAPRYSAPANQAVPLNRNGAVAPVNPPVVFEPPPALTGGAAQVWAAVSGGANNLADPDWGGAAVWISRDGTSYAAIGQVTAPARQGATTAPLPAPTGIPDTNTLAVDLGESGGVLISVGTADAANGATLCLVGNELVAFTTATLTGANRYALGGLIRGLDGSTATAHPAGTRFVRLDGALFKYPLPAGSVGVPLFLKFQSFNIWGGGLQDLSTCVAYGYTPIGSGSFGPTASEIATGTSFDEGLASATASQTDDYGLASDPYVAPVDDGLASDLPGAVAVGAGGTGAITAGQARANIGAATAGANTDITSLAALTAAAIGKAGAGATAALTYQDGGTTIAQAGLIGADRYRVTVSANGTGFTQALDIDPATGHVGLAGYTADGNNALGVLGSTCLFAAATDSMRFTFSKVAAGNDATLSFQTNFSARALLGTTGSDDFQLKVSPDGSSFLQSFVADHLTGNVGFKALLGTASYLVAALPAASFNGALAFAQNGRKAGEAAGAGTGVLACYSNGAWRRPSDDSVVAA